MQFVLALADPKSSSHQVQKIRLLVWGMTYSFLFQQPIQIKPNFIVISFGLKTQLKF